MGARLSWGIADQSLCSLTNFLLNIFVARSLGAEQFGAFSLAYVTYGVANNASRGLSIEPLLVRFSATDMKTWRRAASGSTGTALLVGLATGSMALAAGTVIGGTTGLAFLGLGLMLPGLMLQDSWRYAFFAVARGHLAFINDAIWAAVQIPLLVALKATGHVNVFWFVLAWGAGAAVGAVVATFQARAVPNLIRATSWLIVHRDLGPRFLAENCGSNAANTLQSYSISSLLGVESVGFMQAANMLMGPFRILSFGVAMITIPEGSALLRRAPRKLLRFCAAVSIGQAALAVLWTVALLLALPLGFGHLLLGGLWEKADPLVLPTALAVIGTCAGTGAATGLHAMGAAKRSWRVTVFGAAITLILAIVGAVVDGIPGTLYLAAVGTWIATVALWLQFQQALHERGIPAPTWGIPGSVGRHKKPAIARPPRLSRVAKNSQETPVTSVAVSRPAAQGSYVHEMRQGPPHAARPGEEM